MERTQGRSNGSRLVMATLRFASADGGGVAIVIGVRAGASGPLGLATSFLSRRSGSPFHDVDEAGR